MTKLNHCVLFGNALIDVNPYRFSIFDKYLLDYAPSILAELNERERDDMGVLLVGLSANQPYPLLFVTPR